MKAITLFRRAARWLYDQDEELVEGGCADVSAILLALAQRLKIEARLVEGSARSVEDGTFDHVWLKIEGEAFDPVAYARGRRFREYAPAKLKRGEHVLPWHGSFCDPSDAMNRRFRDAWVDQIIEAFQLHMRRNP